MIYTSNKKTEHCDVKANIDPIKNIKTYRINSLFFLLLIYPNTCSFS